MQKLAKVNIARIQKTALRTFLGAVFVVRPAHSHKKLVASYPITYLPDRIQKG